MSILKSTTVGLLVVIASITASADEISSPASTSLTDRQVTYTLRDDDSADAPADESPQRPIPELPDTVVRGRADPFPAQPLNSETVVSPTGSESLVGQVGSSLTVLNEQQIRATGRTNVAEVIRDSVGLNVVQQGGPGGLTSVFIRGTNSQHTKVFLDGIPINDPSNATRGFDFSTLDVENIERIEVLRGPQSLLYGSDAIGGVINIVTKRGEGPLSVRATSRGGTFGTWRQTLQLSGGDSKHYYSIGGAFSDTDGISQADRRFDNFENDGYSNGTLSGRFGWTPSDLLNVDYVFRWTDVDAEIDDFSFALGRPTDNPIRHGLSETFYNRIQLQSLMLDGAVEQVLAFNLAKYDRRDTDPEFFVPPEFRGQTRKVEWRANVLLAHNNTFSVGARYLQEDASSSFVSKVSQNDAGLFIMDQIELGERWFATVGTRWDDYSTAGPAQTYRATNRINVWETGTAFHGSIGTGFRAPALAENLFQYGNPNLRPERSKGWDIGVQQEMCDGRVTVDCTYFRNDLVDLIVFDFNTFSLQNVGRARTSGVELTGLWQLERGTTLRANYTYTDTLNLDTNTQLLRRPRNKTSIGITKRAFDNRAAINVDVLFTGKRLDTRDVVLGDYTLLNMTATYDLSSHWTAFVRGANLLDKQYEQVYGYGTMGMAVYGGVDFIW